MPPNSPQLNALITRFGASYSSVSMSHESLKKTEESRSDWLNSGNALIQRLSDKMRFLCFPALLGSGEARVIWGGTVKLILIVYFIRNISAKNIKMCSRVSKLWQTKGGIGRFIETRCILNTIIHIFTQCATFIYHFTRNVNTRYAGVYVNVIYIVVNPTFISWL